MNFAVIGTNFITDWLLEAGRHCPDFTLHSVYSRTMGRAEEYAKTHGAKHSLNSLDALCNCSEVDAVYIASPTACHCEQAMLLMKSGKHVLCEKPIASNIRELTAMLKCSAENNVVLLEAMRPEYSPNMDVIKNAVDTIKPVRRVSISFCKYSSRYDKFLTGEPVNTFNPGLSNGALMDLGCYCVLVLLKLFGKPNKIQASAVKLTNGFDAAGAILADYGDLTADLSYSKVSDSYNFCEIQGEGGTLQFGAPSSVREVYLYKRGQEKERIHTPAVEFDMIYELQAFIEYVRNPAGLEARHKNSIDVMDIMDEARRQCGIVYPADLIV